MNLVCYCCRFHFNLFVLSTVQELSKIWYAIYSGDPDAISRVPGGESSSHLKNWDANENLHILNLKYAFFFPSDVVVHISFLICI